MARSIDGDALIAWIKGGQQMTSKMKSVICYIKTMPTIEARPKGEWIYVVQGWHTLRRCSVCKWAQTNSDSKYMGYKYNFCPNCGADMRGGRK